jgi:hypothetical protein
VKETLQTADCVDRIAALDHLGWALVRIHVSSV